MKSIREKAEENCIKYGNLGNVAYQEFEAGANYVLDHLSMTISVSTDGYLRDNLRKMIEQLKKK